MDATFSSLGLKEGNRRIYNHEVRDSNIIKMKLKHKMFLEYFSTKFGGLGENIVTLTEECGLSEKVRLLVVCDFLFRPPDMR